MGFNQFKKYENNLKEMNSIKIGDADVVPYCIPSKLHSIDNKFREVIVERNEYKEAYK